MDERELRRRIERGAACLRAQRQAREAAVVVALVPGRTKADARDIVLEVRASTLGQQPGEVCCPGGHVEPGETPEQAAVRETCEELLVLPAQVEVLGKLGVVPGPGGLPLHVFAAALHGYEDTFSTDEVGSVFRLPMAWVLGHEPDTYMVSYEPRPPEDFPWEKVEGGRGYHWRSKREEVPFYDTNPVVWGATARVLELFARVIRAGV